MAEAEDEANEATGMSEENVSKNLKTSAILESIFVTIAKVKKVNVRDLIWDANLAHFGMSEPPLWRFINCVIEKALFKHQVWFQEQQLQQQKEFQLRMSLLTK